jgi:hypothetical protein
MRGNIGGLHAWYGIQNPRPTGLGGSENSKRRGFAVPYVYSRVETSCSFLYSTLTLLLRRFGRYLLYGGVSWDS